MIDLLHPDPDALLKKWEHVINDTAHIWTFTSALELSWLAEYATRCARIIEVGSFNGRSAKVMLLANPGLSMVCCDTWDDGNFPQFAHNLGPEARAGRIIVMPGSSQLTLKAPEIQHYEFCGCFIDGGHEAHLVKADIENIMPLMRKGSLMSGHDLRKDNDVSQGIKMSLAGYGVENPVDSVWAYQL